MKRAATVLAAWSLLIFASSGGFSQTYTRQQQQEACQDDAYRFCSDAVPDEPRIHACLVRFRNSISPACRAMIQPPSHHRRHRPQ